MSSQYLDNPSRNQTVLILDNVRSAQNVGGIFRTSDAFLVSHLYLCGITATPPHSLLRKTALGADRTIPWTHVQETRTILERLQEEGYQLIALEQSPQAKPLHQLHAVKRNPPYAIIVGNELQGVAPKNLAYIRDHIYIPQYGTKKSLNVAIATGIFLWEHHKKPK